MILLSKNFSLAEAVISQTADRLNLSNDPSPEVLMVMYRTAEHMETIRAVLKAPIIPTSWHRTKVVDLAMREGKPSKYPSQHIKGEAVDFISPRFGTPLAVIKRILSYSDLIPFDQLILEHSWVHISFAINPPRTPRREVLSLLADGSYAYGLTDKSGKHYE